NSSDGSTGNLNLGGTFSQGDYSQVKVHGRMTVGGYGSYYLTNGTLSVDGVQYLGQFFVPGTIVQYGGSSLVGSLQVNAGEFDLYGGQVTATNGITVGGSHYAVLFNVDFGA